jgi:hypothetical protein
MNNLIKETKELTDLFKELVEVQDNLIENLTKENRKLERIAISLLIITTLLITTCLILIFNP